MSLKVGLEFSRNYHYCQGEPLDLLVSPFNAFKHSTYEISRFLKFVFIMYEYRAHPLVSNKYIQKEGRVIHYRVNMGGDARKTSNLENVSSHLLVHSNFSFFFKVAKKLNPLSLAHEIK